MASLHSQRLALLGINVIRNADAEQPSYVEYVRMRGRKFHATSTPPAKSRKHRGHGGRAPSARAR